MAHRAELTDQQRETYGTCIALTGSLSFLG